MDYKKLLKQHTPEELAESFVFPVKPTPKQQKEADRELAEVRSFGYRGLYCKFSPADIIC